MKALKHNPANNKLGSGLTDADVLAAVSKSGYPLQTEVANFLRAQFTHVQEEWSYVDKDKNELRTIDLLAEKWMWDFTLGQPRVRPSLDLLIECKKSDLPYVFFLSPSRPWIPQFPLLAGLHKHELTIMTDDTPSTWVIPMIKALELDSHPFMKDTEYCTSFARCERKGKEVELSGGEFFHGLVLPILKAMQHFQVNESPPKTAQYFDCHVVIGIGVLDAPMVGVGLSGKGHDLTLLPWVRVVRHETEESSNSWHWTRLLAIDVIHKDFLHMYIDEHVLPFADEFRKRVTKHQDILACGRAFAIGMNKNGVMRIEQRLEPIKPSAKLGRYKLIGKNILRFFIGKKAEDY